MSAPMDPGGPTGEFTVRSQRFGADGPLVDTGYLMLIDHRMNPLPAAPADLDLDVHLDSADDLAVLRRRLRAWGAASALSDHDIDDIVIAVDEIATNALEHGRPPAHVRCWTTSDALFVQVDDHGRSRIPATIGYDRPPTDARRGRGIWIARHLADVLTTHTGPAGTTVALRFLRSSASS